ncbi:fructose PTS transporter subunit IIA, partial [Escherichia coli]|uniref:fructose PTS transporter subunit IIA n=1 Tax=Escherichia coli TaxID=562 RepID=UPI003F75882E
MNLTTLTHRDALCLNARFTSREEAIHALTQRLAALGKISSTEQFLEEVYRRESLGPTALGEGLAVPHGKTAAVKEAAFAVATLSEPLQWEGVDGPEAVDLVVLLAIPPNEAGTCIIPPVQRKSASFLCLQSACRIGPWVLTCCVDLCSG